MQLSRLNVCMFLNKVIFSAPSVILDKKNNNMFLIFLNRYFIRIVRILVTFMAVAMWPQK